MSEKKESGNKIVYVIQYMYRSHRPGDEYRTYTQLHEAYTDEIEATKLVDKWNAQNSLGPIEEKRGGLRYWLARIKLNDG